MKWLVAGGVLILAVLLASIVSAQVRRILGAPARSERLQNLAVPPGQFVFSVLIAIGLVAALGIGYHQSLEPLPHDLIAFLPKLLVAGLIVLAGNTAGTLLGNALGQAVLRATGRPQPGVARAVRLAMVGAAAILAVNQLGIDTKVIDLVLSGVVFACAASVAMLTGLGGRQVASEVAAGRYIRHLVRPGDRISFSDAGGAVEGEVVRVHAATVELAGDTADWVLHVPHARLLAATLRVTRITP